MRLRRWSATLGGFLIIFGKDLIQSMDDDYIDIMGLEAKIRMTLTIVFSSSAWFWYNRRSLGFKSNGSIWSGELNPFFYSFLSDNALLTQSRFILMEPILLLFSTLGILYLLKFGEHSSLPPPASQQSKQNAETLSAINASYRKITALIKSWWYAILSAVFLSLALCTKFVGFYSCCLAGAIVFKRFWDGLKDKSVSDAVLFMRLLFRCVIFGMLPVAIYLVVFWFHLNILHKAGPHDMVMTSAFQVSLRSLKSLKSLKSLNVESNLWSN